MRYIPMGALAALALAAAPAIAAPKKEAPAAAPPPVESLTLPNLPKPPLCDPLNLIPGCRNADGTINQKNAAANPLAKLTADMRAKLLADFTYANAVAKATNNTITQPCWQQWVSLLAAQQQPVCVPAAAGANPATPTTATAPATPSPCPSGQVQLAEPDPHVVTDAEYFSEFIQQLQPNSALSLACAPVLQASQRDMATLVSTVLSGGALGLFKLPVP
jgi:hypothetical protein